MDLSEGSGDESDRFDELRIDEILKIVEGHKTWASLIRDEVLFETGLLESGLAWLKELFETRKKKEDEEKKES